MSRSSHAIVALLLHEAGPKGMTLEAICIQAALFPSEAVSICKDLLNAREIERRDGRLFLRTKRRKKQPPAPGFWARLGALFSPPRRAAKLAPATMSTTTKEHAL